MFNTYERIDTQILNMQGIEPDNDSCIVTRDIDSYDLSGLSIEEIYKKK